MENVGAWRVPESRLEVIKRYELNDAENKP